MEKLNNEEKIIKNCIQKVKVLKADNNDGKDFDHSMRVHNLCLEIIERDYAIREINKLNVRLAALLHDIDPADISEFLKDYDDISEAAIMNIILQMDSKKVISIEAAVVQDADMLDSIGAVGIARTFMYNASYRSNQSETIQHFYNDLLLVADKLNTNAAKFMAEKRHKFMEDFLSQYFDEDMISTCNHNGSMRYIAEENHSICMKCGREFTISRKW